MAAVHSDIERLQGTLKYGCAAAERVMKLIPKTRGNWLIGANLLRLMSCKCRCAWLVLSNSGKEVQIELNLTDPPQFSMVKNNRFDLMTASVVRFLLTDGDTCIDVGANWGYFSCIASHGVGFSGLVLSIEPNPRAHRRLLETAASNRLPNVIALNYVAYDRVGKPLYLKQPFYRQTTGSYVRDYGAGEALGVLSTTLDYIWSKTEGRRVRLVKVDTEGAELLVVKGARSLLSDSMPSVIVEISPYAKRFGYAADELYDYMCSLGYSYAYSINDDPNCLGVTGPLGECVEGQIIFQHKDTEPSLQSGRR